MTQPDYRGARGASTGYDFQVLWVLRQALALLDQDTDLMAITVEGLRAEDESGTSQDTWDGVDCTFYYGGEQAATASSVVVNQLKYSAATPNQQWTLARLTSTTNKQRDNSILRKLAKAFKGLKDQRPDLAESGNLIIRLISNQQVDQNVLDSFSSQSMRAELLDVSGLSHDDFEAFIASIDFSECGHSSRFALEEQLFTEVSKWTDDDSRALINDLMRYVRRLMLPESKGEHITRHSVLSWMGVADLGALFPCPSAITLVHRLTSRTISKAIVEQFISGDQRICLHGEGGCGKTTALQEIEMLLPPGSVMIKFDCYGGGRYLDSDAYRHRPQDAFLHLTNDLARQLRIPLLINRGDDIDFPRAFKKRLERASEVIRTRGKDALLVIVIDAADNSVTAANSRSPQERSFVHDFSAIGNLPANVRFIITARSGRLISLNLPRSFSRIAISGFSMEETAAHVKGYWNNLSDAWIEDFHNLSGGNPRVQNYALETAVRLGSDELYHALEYLRPAGKGLDQIFREQLQQAQNKIGSEKEIDVFCSAIATMPRPIPVADLSAVTDLEEEHIRDICSDLSPGIRYLSGLVSLADEDFENFLRMETENQIASLQEAIAKHFVKEHKRSAYAASHVATALLAANRGQEIIELVKSEREPLAIKDPIIRREIYLQRLQLGMKVCRESGNNVGALMTLLIGAEALKTSSVIHRILVENPDLAASFAQESARRIILRDPREIENHGPLLLHLMAVDARNGDSVSVREGYRQVQAWLQSRRLFFEERRSRYPDSTPHGWDIDYQDIAAETEALLRTVGLKRAIASLRRWRPKQIALEVAMSLCSRFIITGEETILEKTLSEDIVSKPWDLFVLVCLGLTGREVDLSRLESSLGTLLRRRLVHLDASVLYKDREFNEKYLDVVLTACEIYIARGGHPIRVKPMLEHFSDEKYRNPENLSTLQTSQIDLTLRAYALVERLAGRALTLDSYFATALTSPDSVSTKTKSQVETRQRTDELRRFIAPLIGIYDTRAQLLVGNITASDFMPNIDQAIKQYKNKPALERNWSAPEEYIRAQVTLSLSRLMMVTGIDIPALFEFTNSLITGVPDTAHKRDVVLAQFAMIPSMHQRIVSMAAEQASVVRSARISAEDKIATLVSLARLLLPISLNDARSFFNEAIEISSEIDAHVEQEIAVFTPLIDRAVSSINGDKRRELAHNLAVAVSDASFRLGGLNTVTWSKAGHALATADLPFALAATGRWEDLNIAKRNLLLPSILDAALINRDMTPNQVAALFPLIDQLDEDVLLKVIDYANDQGEHVDRKALAEHLAKEEVLRFGKSPRQTVSNRLSFLRSRNSSGRWQQLLDRTTEFYEGSSSELASHTDELGSSPHKVNSKKGLPDPLAGFDWTEFRFASSEEIHTAFSWALSVREATRDYIPTSLIFDKMASVVKVRDHASHLTALASLDVSQYHESELADAIARRIENWHSFPAVGQWCREQLLDVIASLLPGFSRYLSIAMSPLPTLLKKSGAPDTAIRTALLSGIEQHVEQLNPAAIYALVGLLAQYCAPSEIAQVAEQYANRLVERISPEERETWHLDDVPDNTVDGVARLVYALMGDIDLRIRWRASYVARNLAHLGEHIILYRLIELYERKQEQSFRDSGSPFYWLASRLWLMIALDRIATDEAEVLKSYGLWIFERATDNDFPHTLLRSFAKSVVVKLVENGCFEIDPAQRELLDSTNTSLTRRERVRHSRQAGVENFATQRVASRRFQFNRMDTLPYWYDVVREFFSDVEAEEFLDEAERWIVERWELSGSPWNWEEEPRKHRLNDEPHLPIDHRHGSLPTLERYSTHLEWHAMWCTIGQLLLTRPLATADDSYEDFDEWLQREGLTIPPFWLSDLLTVKPHKEQLWFPPQNDIEVWVENVNDSDLLAELELDEKDESVTVGSYYSACSSNFTLSARVVTALVSPPTANALMRALQTIENSWDYKLPQAEDGFEIDVPHYKLLGWLSYPEPHLGLEERDPLRYEVRKIECEPSLKTTEMLNLTFAYDGQAKWIESESGATIFSYKTWGDNRGDEREESFRYDRSVRSEGWSLGIDRRTLKAFLEKMGRDLIVEIEITRKNKGYAYYSRYEEERPKETRHERVLLLRQDGSLEAIEGRIGTWTAPSS